MKSTPSKGEPRSADLAFEIRGLCCVNDEPRSADLASEIRSLCCVKASDSFVAHALSVPRRDSSRRPAQFGHPSSTNAPNTTKQTQFRQTLMESMPSEDKQGCLSPPGSTDLVGTGTLAGPSPRSGDAVRSADLAVEIRGLCSAPPQTGNAKPSVAHYRLPDAAGPADGTQLLPSRAREQAVSSEIPFGFLKEEVFSRTRERAVERRSRPPWMNTCVEREQREQGSRSSAPMAF